MGVKVLNAPLSVEHLFLEGRSRGTAVGETLFGFCEASLQVIFLRLILCEHSAGGIPVSFEVVSAAARSFQLRDGVAQLRLQIRLCLLLRARSLPGLLQRRPLRSERRPLRLQRRLARRRVVLERLELSTQSLTLASDCGHLHGCVSVRCALPLPGLIQRFPRFRQRRLALRDRRSVVLQRLAISTQSLALSKQSLTLASDFGHLRESVSVRCAHLLPELIQRFPLFRQRRLALRNRRRVVLERFALSTQSLTLALDFGHLRGCVSVRCAHLLAELIQRFPLFRQRRLAFRYRRRVILEHVALSKKGLTLASDFGQLRGCVSVRCAHTLPDFMERFPLF